MTFNSCHPYSQSLYGVRTVNIDHLTAKTNKVLALNSQMEYAHVNAKTVGTIGDQMTIGFVPVQKGETMADLIDRQAAIDAIGKIERTDNWKAAVSMVLYDLPSAQPERKKGEWLDGGMKGVYYCSECKHKIMTNVYVDQRPLWKYCPNCGSYNGGEDE